MEVNQPSLRVITSMSDIMEHTCSLIVGGSKAVWRVDTLWNYAKDIEIELKSLSDFDLAVDCWFQDVQAPTLLNVAKHTQRINNADITFPILLTPDGDVLDGFHRLAKAWIMSLENIPTIQLRNLPPPDYLIK